MGGDCIGSDLVYYSTGIDFVKAVIDVACGKAPNLKPDAKPQPAKVVFILSNEDRAEFERIEAEEPEKILQVVDRQYELIGKVTDSSNRAGCYILKN
jgi:biotin carboxylase